MAALAAEGRAVAQEVNDFINGDHSHMSAEEYRNMQRKLFAKQQHTIEALSAAMGMGKEQPTKLMQSEDADVADIRRLAGITERKD